MNWTLIAIYLGQLFALLAHYGPEAPTIIAKVSAFLAAKDYVGLLKYIASLIAGQPAAVSTEHAAALQHVHDGLKAALGA